MTGFTCLLDLYEATLPDENNLRVTCHHQHHLDDEELLNLVQSLAFAIGVVKILRVVVFVLSFHWRLGCRIQLWLSIAIDLCLAAHPYHVVYATSR